MSCLMISEVTHTHTNALPPSLSPHHILPKQYPQSRSVFKIFHILFPSEPCISFNLASFFTHRLNINTFAQERQSLYMGTAASVGGFWKFGPITLSICCQRGGPAAD